MPLHLFSGYDEREAIGYDVFRSSVREHTQAEVRIEPVGQIGGPQGSNAFTFSRFLVPWMVGRRAPCAVFVDGVDMVCLADIAGLFAELDDRKAVQVVKHSPYKTRHPMKYRMTDMQCPNHDYERKNWASVMLFNTLHPLWADLTPIDVFAEKRLDILQLRWIPDSLIGDLSPSWNVLVDEGQPIAGAKLLHWTAGMPGFPHYADAPGAELWHAQRQRMTAGT